MSRYRIISRTFAKTGHKKFYAQVRKWGIWLYVGTCYGSRYPLSIFINSSGYQFLEGAQDCLKCYEIFLKDRAEKKAIKKPKKQRPIIKVEYEYEH